MSPSACIVSTHLDYRLHYTCFTCRQSNEEHPWMRHGAKASSKAASEQWACLLSVLAGMHTGRAYLCSAATMVVQQLCHWVQAAHDLYQSNASALAPILCSPRSFQVSAGNGYVIHTHMIVANCRSLQHAMLCITFFLCQAIEVLSLCVLVMHTACMWSDMNLG